MQPTPSNTRASNSSVSPPAPCVGWPARLVLTLTLCLLLPGSVVSQTPTGEGDYLLDESPVPPSRLKGLEGDIEAMIQHWRVPGLAIAIVEDSRVVFSRGFGYRDLEERQPVDPDTLFAVGSISKSFLVVALGMLADEGCPGVGSACDRLFARLPAEGRRGDPSSHAEGSGHSSVRIAATRRHSGTAPV